MIRHWRPLALAVTLVACSEDDKLTFAGLAGDWDCTEYLYVDFADPGNTFDVLASVGISLSVEIRSDGTLILIFDGTPVDTVAATLDGDILTINDTEYRIALSGDNMTMTGRDTIPVDFDLDGTEEDAFERIEWLRR